MTVSLLQEYYKVVNKKSSITSDIIETDPKDQEEIFNAK